MNAKDNSVLWTTICVCVLLWYCGRRFLFVCFCGIVDDDLCLCAFVGFQEDCFFFLSLGFTVATKLSACLDRWVGFHSLGKTPPGFNQSSVGFYVPGRTNCVSNLDRLGDVPEP